MAFGTITSTSNTFGSVDGTATGSVPGTLSGSVGVPGPQGPAGSQGPQGEPGEGVPAGGTTGQALVKTSNTDYATGWTTLNLTQYLLKASNLSDLTNVTTARDNLLLGNTNTPTFLGIDGQAGGSNIGDTLKGYSLGTAGEASECGFQFSSQSYVDDGEGNPIIGNVRAGSYGEGGLSFSYRANGSAYVNRLRWDGSEEGKLVVSSTDYSSGNLISSVAVNPTSIVFPNASVQTIAFPGFNNAALTGNPTAPTPATSDNDTSIATTAFVKAQGYLTSAPVTSVAGRTGAITLSNTDISGLGSLAVINDAPSNGSQYARKNAAWDVVIPGDRYLTSSTTSLTVSNGNKTLTVGTGLSYTPTQNVTISFDASNHMHGEVLTYNSGTGVMTVDVNHHTGSGTYTAWVVNVGGVTPATSVAWGAITGTLSAQTDLNTALGLKADLASPTFTGTPSLPTGTIGVTQTAGDNTTALATTAFVTASNPDASTTVKGHVELATNAEVIAGTSTTTAIVPGNAGFLLTDPRLRSLAAINGSAVQGSGVASSSSGFTQGREMYLSTLATGRAAWSYGIVGVVGFNTSLASRAQIDFSKKVWMSGYASFGITASGTPYMGDANTMCRITLGGYSTNTTGDMTLRGIGLKKVGGVGSFVTLTVHDGTTLTDVATTVTVADGAGINWVIYSDGTGNVTLYINGTQAATTTAGPTSATGSNAGCYREQVEAVATPGVRQSLNIGAGGGWLYLEG